LEKSLVDNTQRLIVFRAQTENVRELERAWKHVNRQLNDAIRSKNPHGIAINTKFLALTYCALAEARFSKLIHTPFGLQLSYISQIKKATADGGVKLGWLKCVELALKAIESSKGNHVPNVKQRLSNLIDAYIFDPSILRNKLAHGQWVKALNRENTAENAKMTSEIAILDAVDLYRRKFALERLSAIVEDMIESPDRAHFNAYWDHLSLLEGRLSEMNGWTMTKKISSLAAKSP
jgi:hypothetical protein